jgi:hypothetical protein
MIPANGKIDTALANVRWDTAGWTCNSASRISISARALRINTPRTSLGPSQSQTINFTARVSGWTTSEAVVTTGEATAIGTGALYTGVAQVQAAPKSGGLTIRVGNFVVADQKGSSSNNAKPIEGPYSATITITLAPNS